MINQGSEYRTPGPEIFSVLPKKIVGSKFSVFPEKKLWFSWKNFRSEKFAGRITGLLVIS